MYLKNRERHTVFFLILSMAAIIIAMFLFIISIENLKRVQQEIREALPLTVKGATIQKKIAGPKLPINIYGN